MVIISGAGTSPWNFTVAVTIPAVAGSTDGPAAGGGAAGVELPATGEREREKSYRSGKTQPSA